MVELRASAPFDGLLPPGAMPGLTLRAPPPEPTWLVSPFRGQRDAVAGAIGLPWPDPGRYTASGGARLLSVGPGRALLSGAAPPAAGAAVVDQGDAFALLIVEGAQAREILARLVPVDLSPEAFGADATARTLIGHMTGGVTRIGPDAFELQVFRSMAATLAEDLDRAARGVAARHAR